LEKRFKDKLNGYEIATRQLLDTKAVATYLGVSDWTVRELYWRGDLTGVKIGRLVRFDREDLDAFIQRNKITNGQEV
jgi:excisionase family DNA binding protein